MCTSIFSALSLSFTLTLPFPLPLPLLNSNFLHENEYETKCAEVGCYGSKRE